MSYENIIVEKSEGIITVSLNRPDALNALNDQLMDELLLEVDNYEKDGQTREWVEVVADNFQMLDRSTDAPSADNEIN